MDPVSARRLISDCGVIFADWRVVESSEAAVNVAAGCQGPVALKSAAADVVHKSDSGCVVLGVAGDDAVEKAYTEITARAAAAGSETPAPVSPVGRTASRTIARKTSLSTFRTVHEWPPSWVVRTSDASHSPSLSSAAAGTWRASSPGRKPHAHTCARVHPR